MNRRTKIVCTLGPATDDERVLRGLMQAGMDAARINFSHGTRADHERRIAAVRAVAERLGKPVSILQDLCGPRLRLGAFREGQVSIRDGAEFVLTTKRVMGDAGCAQVQFEALPQFVRRGDRILLADGARELRVVRVRGDEIACRVVRGGVLRSHQGLNVPDTDLPIPAFTRKDREDLLFGIRREVDWVAMSFVGSARDLQPARALLRRGRSKAMLMAKVEKRQAIENLEEILEAADGLMVARGDLGVEVALDRVPVLQKRIIRMCNDAGKPVVTATQMLESMLQNPQPTRAEVSDIANAVLDGTDALMLSGETAVGRYPVAAAKIMARAAACAESQIDFDAVRLRHAGAFAENPTEAIAEAACLIAHDLRARAIISSTSSGFTAQMVSKHRPACPIIAPTADCGTYRRLCMVWGVTPVLVARTRNTDEMFEQAVKGALRTGLVRRGDLVVITSGVRPGVAGQTSLVRIARVGAR